MIAIDTLTPTERRMLSVLLDYGQHAKGKLVECMSDQESLKGFGQHMYNLRRKLRVNGFSVALVRINGVNYYQLVRTMASPYDGKS